MVTRPRAIVQLIDFGVVLYGPRPYRRKPRRVQERRERRRRETLPVSHERVVVGVRVAVQIRVPVMGAVALLVGIMEYSFQADGRDSEQSTGLQGSIQMS